MVGVEWTGDSRNQPNGNHEFGLFKRDLVPVERRTSSDKDAEPPQTQPDVGMDMILLEQLRPGEILESCVSEMCGTNTSVINCSLFVHRLSGRWGLRMRMRTGDKTRVAGRQITYALHSVIARILELSCTVFVDFDHIPSRRRNDDRKWSRGPF